MVSVQSHCFNTKTDALHPTPGQAKPLNPETVCRSQAVDDTQGSDSESECQPAEASSCFQSPCSSNAGETHENTELTNLPAEKSLRAGRRRETRASGGSLRVGWV